jgi:deoxyhypusine synthase
MVFFGICVFLLNPLKVDGMNHVLSELVLQKFVCCIVTCGIAAYHVHHEIMQMHHDMNINSQVHFNLEQGCTYPIPT